MRLSEHEAKAAPTTPLLHGSDLSAKQSFITVTCTGIRPAPDGFNSPAIMDFEPVKIKEKEFGAIALNKSNIRAIKELVGDIDVDDLYAEVTFTKVPVRNPKTGEETWGLRITHVDLKKRPKGKRKPDDEDVPF